MTAYFIRRFLLVIPTFLGITFLAFTVYRFVPGGPVEQAIAAYQMQMGAAGGGEAGASSSGGGSGTDQVTMSPEMVQKLKEIYGFDKPFYVAYLIWLNKLSPLGFNLEKEGFMKTVLSFHPKWPDMGVSDTYSRPVFDVISERFPISIRFGLIGFMLSYLVCIPLGVWKAVKHGEVFDWGSSVVVFIGYSIPGWVLGIVLLVYFGGGSFWQIFPLGGIHSPSYDDLGFWQQCWDTVWHMVLPVLCYMVGSFATLTILMKNSLMENLGQDYVRTAFAKGLSEKKVIFVHALRNSLIPIATGLGHLFSLILAGSYLIEKVFNIHGFGLLGYSSLIARDYPVMLGILVIASILKLFGNIISDFLYCMIDPRIRFS